MPDKVPWICFSPFAPTLFDLEIWTRATFRAVKDRSSSSHLSIFFILFRWMLMMLGCWFVLSRGAERHFGGKKRYISKHGLKLMVILHFLDSKGSVLRLLFTPCYWPSPCTVNQSGPSDTCRRWWRWLGKGQGFFSCVPPLERNF